MVQFHCDAYILWFHACDSHRLFILKVPVPEDTQSQRQDEEEEEYDEGHVSRVHYNDYMAYSQYSIHAPKT